MKKIINLTSEAYQRHTIIFERDTVVLELRFLPQVERWFINIEYRNKKVSGVFLALGVLHINNALLPFDFIVNESSGTDLDPFLINDFEGRCNLYMLEPSEMESIRGLPVAI